MIWWFHWSWIGLSWWLVYSFNWLTNDNRLNWLDIFNRFWLLWNYWIWFCNGLIWFLLWDLSINRLWFNTWNNRFWISGSWNDWLNSGCLNIWLFLGHFGWSLLLNDVHWLVDKNLLSLRFGQITIMMRIFNFFCQSLSFSWSDLVFLLLLWFLRHEKVLIWRHGFGLVSDVVIIMLDFRIDDICLWPRFLFRYFSWRVFRLWVSFYFSLLGILWFRFGLYLWLVRNDGCRWFLLSDWRGIRDWLRLLNTLLCRSLRKIIIVRSLWSWGWWSLWLRLSLSDIQTNDSSEPSCGKNFHHTLIHFLLIFFRGIRAEDDISLPTDKISLAWNRVTKTGNKVTITIELIYWSIDSIDMTWNSKKYWYHWLYCHNL